MYTASKSKSKEMPSPKSAKEQQKAFPKLSGSTNSSNSNPASAYNPVSGTFHSLDTTPLTSSPLLQSKFQNVDETDEHSAEYDSLSNNGSCSGESEDHKDKAASTTARQETIPGSDIDKREKIRQKNEKKHQRQRERRAQELHERCTGYLMSRKLESLSQQLVAMGISADRATLALILNEGRLQESVNWLFEGNEEEAERKDVASGSNLKLDISEELARITAMEVKYKCSKQEVERAVIAWEGDLKKAEETLRTQKPDPPIIPPKPEEAPIPKHQMRPLEKPAATITTQPSRNEINSSNRAAMATKLSEPGSRNPQPTKTQSNLLTEKRWPTAGSSSSSSYSMGPKIVAQRSVGGNEGRNIPVKEPVIMMQRPQSMYIKQNPVTNISASPPGTSGWYTNKVATHENMKLNSKLLQNQSTGGYGGYGAESLTSQHLYQQSHINRNMGPENLSTQQYYPQTHYTHRSHTSSSFDSDLARLGSTWSAMGASAPSPNGPSSFGLFSGWGSTGTPGHADWNARDVMYNCDYNSIDWTLELTPSPPKASESMLGLRNKGASGMRVAGLRDGGMPIETTASSGAPCEWTSPFAGKDIFSLPRQFVTSPSP